MSVPAGSTVAPYRLIGCSDSPQRQRRKAGPRRSPPTDPAVRHWLGAFHQFHTENDTYTPVAMRLSPVDGGSAKGSAAALAMDRHVYEVALRHDAKGERWTLILWEIDAPGIQFCDCAGRDEALALFAEPSKAAGRWSGVRLRPESRPW